MIPNAFITTLKNSLTEGGNETEVFVNDIKTQDGDTIDISDFAKLGNVGYLIIDNGTSRAEYIKFTGIDTVNKKFTGITRGLSFRANNDNRVNANVKFHPAGATVEIVNNTHYLNHFVDKNSNETIGGVKTFTSIPILPAQNPTNDNEAARKAYVDAVGSGAVGSASETVAGKVKLDKPSPVDPRVFAVLVHQQMTPNLTLRVEPFSLSGVDGIIDFAGGNSPSFAVPTTHPRIDLLVIRSGSLAIVQGTENATPTLPTPQLGDFVICSVYNRVGETSIKDKDDGTNGYILKHFIGDTYNYNNFVKKTGDETISGIKTFSSIPVLPATDPTTDNQATRKSYVDTLNNSIKNSLLAFERVIKSNFWSSTPGPLTENIFNGFKSIKSGGDNLLFYSYIINNGTSVDVYLRRLLSNSNISFLHDKYYNFNVSYGVSISEINGFIVIHNGYLYTFYYLYTNTANFIMKRYNLDLTLPTDITWNGATGYFTNKGAVSDGTYIYNYYPLINAVYRFTISGTQITKETDLTLGSQHPSDGYILHVDANYIYILGSDFYIYKYNKSTGQFVSKTSWMYEMYQQNGKSLCYIEDIPYYIRFIKRYNGSSIYYDVHASYLNITQLV